MSVQMKRAQNSTGFATMKLPSKYRNSNSPFLNKCFTQELHPSRTMRLDKIRSKLTEFLNQRTLTKNDDLQVVKSQSISQSIGTVKKPLYSQKQGSRYFPSNNKYSHDRNLYHEKRNTHIQLRKHKSPQQKIQEISRQSFMIKQIKPQVKQRYSKDRRMVSPGLGKVFGSYYQVVAIQKNFRHSKYCWSQNPQFLNNRSQYLDQRYQSRIINPQNNMSPLRKQNRIINTSNYISRSPLQSKRNKINNDGQISKLQPWKNLDESIIDF